jgi:hypothetical protein
LHQVNFFAWRIFSLSRLSEEFKHSSCDKVLTDFEWKILYRKFNKGCNLPKKTPSLHDVLIWIGRLGGFLGRNSDRKPGFTSLWRGWQRFEEIVEDYRDFCG